MMMEQQPTQEQTLSQRVHWLFFDSDPEFTRFVSALAMFGWAVQLLRSGDTFHTSTAFDGLAHRFTWMPWGSETTWGLLALWLSITIAGTAWRAGVAGAAEWRRRINRQAHAASLFLAAVWWLYITISIYLSQPISTGPAPYFALFIGALWAFWRYMARHDVVPRRYER